MTDPREHIDMPQPQQPPEAQSSLRARWALRHRIKREITHWRMIGVSAVSVIMIFGCLIGALFFARPTSSAVEMRNLTSFPEFSLESFANGSYFSELSLWYADTYPLREALVSADHWLKGFFGIDTGEGMVGGNNQADDIPVDDAVTYAPVDPPAQAPEEKKVNADIQDNIMSGVYISNGAGYSIFYFSQVAADTYITAMNTAAQRLDGHATVYSILAPANSITLDDAEARKVGGSDQKQTLKYLETRFDQRVQSVNLVDTIKQHRDENLYFKTDHHWTQIGAYYAYNAFCAKKGISPLPLSSWEEIPMGDFRGTYYETIHSMGYNPADTVYGYIPSSTNTMTYWTEDGQEVVGPIVNDDAYNWDLEAKYSAFAAGDQKLEIITNPKLHDGSSCLVVKDSYGCAFIPELVDQYETIHVIDFRKNNTNIVDYAIEHNLKDVIFINGIKIGLTDSAAATLLSQVSEPQSGEQPNDGDANTEDGENAGEGDNTEEGDDQNLEEGQ